MQRTTITPEKTLAAQQQPKEPAATNPCSRQMNVVQRNQVAAALVAHLHLLEAVMGTSFRQMPAILPRLVAAAPVAHRQLMAAMRLSFRLVAVVGPQVAAKLVAHRLLGKNLA